MWLLKRRNFWIIILCDVILLALSYASAFWIRYERLSPQVVNILLTTLPAVILIKVASFFFFDFYRGMWRYTSVNDLVNLIKGSLVGSLLLVGYLAMFRHFSGISRSVIVADCAFTIVAIGGVRLLVRLYYQRDPCFFDGFLFWKAGNRDSKKVLIAGTGLLAERLFREVTSQPTLKYHIIGFIDPLGLNSGMKIHGVPIVGSIREISPVLAQHNPEEIFIAAPELKAKQINELIDLCSGAGIRLKVIPSLTDRINGSVSDHLRDIKVEDLLEREPVKLDMELVAGELEGRRVLITGAGGSIGSELARQVLMFNPSDLILLDSAETPLYEIDMELGGTGSATRVIPCIGDIRTFKGLDRIFKKHKPEYIYHAAAYKHVPMMEHNPLDAINNNIIGTYKLASVAMRHKVQKFVMISTDKAVKPNSIMGATKRVAEMVVQALNGNGTRFVVVRFGNVLGSNGSVVPLFEKQIASGGPVTVTAQDVTRYFMTIPEAVMLVLQAGALGTGGELFILEMGAPVKILDLAKNMIRLAGLVPDRDIKIQFTGLRPGEKMHEELLVDGESIVDTAYNKIKICKNCNGVDEKDLFSSLEHFRLILKSSGDQQAAVEILKHLIPSFSGCTMTEERPDQEPVLTGPYAEVRFDERVM